MIGSSSTPATRTASATSNSTCCSVAARSGCFASVHGSVCAMYSLVALIRR